MKLRLIFAFFFFCFNINAQVAKKIELTTPGTLSTALTAEEKASVTNLTVSGKIDARDFSTLEDEMKSLLILDLSEAHISAFSGARKSGQISVSYPENAIPMAAFQGNKNITSIVIPNSTDSLSYWAFSGFKGNINVNENNIHFSSLDGVLYNKSKTKLYRCPVSKSGIYTVPSTVIYIGHDAFGSCQLLTKIELPKSLSYIDRYAFSGCSGLLSFFIPESVSFIEEDALFEYKGDCNFGQIEVDAQNKFFSSLDGILYDKTKTKLIICPKLKKGSFAIPETVISIENKAFLACEELTDIVIPSSVKAIGRRAFDGCTKLTGQLVIPASVTKIEDFTFSGCNLTGVIISSSVTSIGDWAFMGNPQIKTINIPSSVTFLGDAAFGLSGLISVYTNSPLPIYFDPLISKDVFWSTDKTRCKLYVPFGTKPLYTTANQWKDFTNIVEDPQGFSVGATSIAVASTDGSNASVSIKSNVNWTANSDQSWLQVDPINGSGTLSLTVTAAANPLLTVRTATVTVSAEGELSQYITVKQDATPKIINNIAGNLSSVLTSDDFKNVTSIAITGTIDARDFRVMRDNMPLVTDIDLSAATILEYSGIDGTIGINEYTRYPANTVPLNAFLDIWKNKGKLSLRKMILPLSLTAIDASAFAGTLNLSNIFIPKFVSKIDPSAFNNSTSIFTVDPENLYFSVLEGVLFSKNKTVLFRCPLTKEGAFEIPPSVVSIQNDAFKGCSRLSSIKLSPSITSIGYNAFYECTGISGNIKLPKTLESIGFAAFFSCRSLTGTLSIPPSVTSIGGYAFANCNGFTSLIIPTSVTSIGSSAFASCQGLTSIYANSSVPIGLSSVTSVFDYVDKDKCILYVPIGSKTAYQAALQWKDFKNIVETTATEVKSINVTNIDIYPNPFVDGFWVRGIDNATRLRLYDINGKLMLQKELLIDEFENASFLPNGIYIIKLSSSFYNIGFKIIKKN